MPAQLSRSESTAVAAKMNVVAQIITIHPDNPQKRYVDQAVDIIRSGGLIVYPTDSSYALGCQLGNKKALDRIRRIREADKLHDFSLVVRDLSEIAAYARVDNWAYRLLKHFTPGPYTFILKATREVPNRLKNPKKKTIGIRVPDHPICQALLEALGEPMMSSTLLLPGDDFPMTDPIEIAGRLGNRVDAVVDGGAGGLEPSSVLDLTEGAVRIVRRGIGDVSTFE